MQFVWLFLLLWLLVSFDEFIFELFGIMGYAYSFRLNSPWKDYNFNLFISLLMGVLVHPYSANYSRY